MKPSSPRPPACRCFAPCGGDCCAPSRRALTEKRWRERPSTIYHLYQSEFGIIVVRAHERLRAVGADRAAARVLGVAPGLPVLQVRSVAIALGGRAVEWRVSTVVTAQHDYVNLLSRPA